MVADISRVEAKREGVELGCSRAPPAGSLRETKFLPPLNQNFCSENEHVRQSHLSGRGFAGALVAVAAGTSSAFNKRGVDGSVCCEGRFVLHCDSAAKA